MLTVHQSLALTTNSEDILKARLVGSRVSVLQSRRRRGAKPGDAPPPGTRGDPHLGRLS